jgi:glycyl-tRNA synthetase
MRFHPALAPVKVAVLPLSKKLSEKALEVHAKLSKKFMCDFDDAGSIGKRYRRQDEIGTPFCITYDFDSEENSTVTIRERDSMEQVTISIDELENYFADKFEF